MSDETARPFLVRRHREAVIVLAGLLFGAGLVAAAEDPYDDGDSPFEVQYEEGSETGELPPRRGKVRLIDPDALPDLPEMREPPRIEVEDLPEPELPPQEYYRVPQMPRMGDSSGGSGGSVQTIPPPEMPDYPPPTFEDPYDEGE